MKPGDGLIGVDLQHWQANRTHRGEKHALPVSGGRSIGALGPRQL
jgi:hypothetical protein